MTQLEMRRINLQFFKDHNPPSDLTQVPASGATYTVFRQGATVRTAASFPSSSTVRVTVYDTGHVVSGDRLQWSQDLSQIFYVVDIDPGRAWLDLQLVTGPVTVAAGDRLIPLYTPPALYSDSVGTVALGSNVITLDGEGRGTFFCNPTTYDAVLAGAGPLRFLIDQAGGLARSLPWVNAGDYDTLQEAIAATPAGGKLLIPVGVYTCPSAFGWTVDKPIEIIGSGIGNISTGINGTVLRPATASGSTKDSTVLNLTYASNAATYGSASRCVIRDLAIGPTVAPSSAGVGDGIAMILGSTDPACDGPIIRNVQVFGMGRRGINLSGYDSGSHSINLAYLENVECFSCKGTDSGSTGGAGVWLQNCVAAMLVHVYSHANDMWGIRLSSASSSGLFGCYVESNYGSGADTNYGAQIYLTSSHSTSIVQTGFENFQTAGGNKIGLVIDNCWNARVDNCKFLNASEINPSPGPVARGIRIMDDNRGIFIGTNRFSNMYISVSIKGGSKNRGCTIAPQVMDSPTYGCNPDIPNENDTTGPNLASGYNLWGMTRGGTDTVKSSDFLGFVLPRINGTAEIDGYSAAREGLLVLDVTAGANGTVKMYANGGWRTVAAL